MCPSATEDNTAEHQRTYEEHMKLLEIGPSQSEAHDLVTAPIFSMAACEYVSTELTGNDEKWFAQYGLIAGNAELLLRHEKTPKGAHALPLKDDPRLFFNVGAPSSVFICGSQGSGKSHTLSCLLENCLMPSKAGVLPKPLTGIVFHYDNFTPDRSGSPCEAAYLFSNPDIKVRVLCSPTNYNTIKSTYKEMKITVEPLLIREKDLNTKRMLDIMTAGNTEGTRPLYFQTISRVLREMRIAQQESKGTFDYSSFKTKVTRDGGLTPAQLGPLNQRLETLESFMPKGNSMGNKSGGGEGNNWEHKSGSLTIVDLSCPCVTPEAACSLFNICLSIFLEQEMKTGRVIALDEAHKFMNDSAEASAFTSTLLSTIRQQRHVGARVIISTQEPTISPALLDLCSVTIVHRFSSPTWLSALKQHLAAASNLTEVGDETNGASSGKNILPKIVGLNVGEALLFAPSAIVDVETGSGGVTKVKRLGEKYLKIRIRSRLTNDGGKSIIAS